jgi:ABC-2 type transport system permease protein
MTAYAITDSATMLRRSLRRMRRYPSLTLFTAAIPVVLLLLFVYVFGGTLGAGLGGPSIAAEGRDAYLAYVVPGILLLTVAGAATGTAISVAMDMTAGIIARFRTMAIARGSVLTGHVVGSVIQTFLALGLVVVVAVVIGYRPAAGPGAWLAATGLLALTAVGGCAPSVPPRAGDRQRRDRQQLPDDLHAAALPEFGLRPDCVDAGPAALVRRAPALHADRRVASCAACGYAGRG